MVRRSFIFPGPRSQKRLFGAILQVCIPEFWEDSSIRRWSRAIFIFEKETLLLTSGQVAAIT